MDAQELLGLIDVDKMKTLLTELGAQHIIDHSDNPQKKNCLITNTICHNISDGTLKLYYYPESQYFHCYTDCGENFNIFELVMRNHKLKGVELSFPESIAWICSKLGIKQASFRRADGFGNNLPKGNSELDYYKNMRKKKPLVAELREHDNIILGLFSDYHHPSFLDDYITHEAMNEFNILYNFADHAVVVPHLHWESGEIVGIRQRFLSQDMLDRGYKYLPLTAHGVLYSYPMYANLYGYYQNKDNIKRIRKVLLFESEKSVMQCESFVGRENNIALAVCGSNISARHVELIKMLNPEEVVICFDKENSDSLDERSMDYQMKLLRAGRMFSSYMQTSVIYDDNGILDEKNSPTDKGYEVFMELLQGRKEITTKE